MPDAKPNRVRAIVTALLVGALAAACGSRSSGPPPQSPSSAEAPPWDAGLPPPPRSARHGVIVPSDMGLGAGSSGPSSNSGTSPPVSPSVGGPPSVGN